MVFRTRIDVHPPIAQTIQQNLCQTVPAKNRWVPLYTLPTVPTSHGTCRGPPNLILRHHTFVEGPSSRTAGASVPKRVSRVSRGRSTRPEASQQSTAPPSQPRGAPGPRGWGPLGGESPDVTGRHPDVSGLSPESGAEGLGW